MANNEFDPWEYMEWLMQLSDSRMSSEEGQAEIDRQMEKFTPAQRKELRAFMDRNIVIDKDGDYVNVQLIDGARRRGLL